MTSVDANASGAVRLEPVLSTLPSGFEALREEARAEGYRHLDRLDADWAAAITRFDRPGELLSAAYSHGELAAVGGLTVDPHLPDALRMRRFYVRKSCRRGGLGRALAEKLLRRARATFPLVAVNAAPGGAVFWESLGFVADARDGHTHVLGHNDRSEPGRGRQMRAVYEDRYFRVVAPDFPLNSRADGGHLILFKKRPVGDRSELSGEEAIDFMRITMIVGRAMYDVLGVERMNYEDLGNWGIDEPGGAKMHLHFFGRAREQIHQIRGQHIFLYPKDHPIYKGHLERFDDEDLRRLETRIAELVAEPKYRKMAEQAGLTRNRAPSSP